MTSFRQPEEAVRHTLFLGMLARLGASEQELATAAQMISHREMALQQRGLATAVDEASRESVAQFRAWCQQRGFKPETMDEATLEQLLEQAIHQVRTE